MYCRSKQASKMWLMPTRIGYIRAVDPCAPCRFAYERGRKLEAAEPCRKSFLALETQKKEKEG